MSKKGAFVKLTLLLLLGLFGLLLMLNARQPRHMLVEQQIEVVSHVQFSSSNKSELLLQLQQELPELDYAFWYEHARTGRYRLNNSCACYPNPLELQLHNIYWQTFRNGNVTFHLYAAYLDKRQAVNGAVLRVLATANQNGLSFPPAFCQLWYEQQTQPTIVEVSESLGLWPTVWGLSGTLEYPHLLSCALAVPKNGLLQLPRTVSLVSAPCERASNSLRVNYEPSQATNASEHSVGVCLKALDFPFVDISERLIEWFELQRLFGAKRIYSYLYDVHPQVQRVLDYYQRQGLLQLTSLTLPNGMPRLRHYQHMLLEQRMDIKRLNELIAYNDCFYRHMYQHDYMLNVDVDELMVPLGKRKTWTDVLHATELHFSAKMPSSCEGFFAICFLNVYFVNLLPEPQDHEHMDLYMLEHTLRTANHSKKGIATKCFHNTKYSLALHNHFSLKSLAGCPITLNKLVAQLQHYRDPSYNYTRQQLVEDRSLWKYATQLRQRVKYVHEHLDDVEINERELESTQD